MLNNLMSLFLKPEDDRGEGTGNQPPPQPPPVFKSDVPSVPSLQPLPAGTAESEKKFSDRLGQALADANLPSIDFFEFLKSLEAMAPLIPDEATRYRAALGSLVASGASVENILGTAAHYLKVLEEKEKSFRAYSSEQLKERVSHALAEADRLRNEIRAKGEKIAVLTQEIAELTRTEATTRSEAEIARAEIDAYSATFERVKLRYSQLIQSTRDKLAAYAGITKY